MKRARYYELVENKIHCKLCPHKCKISPTKVGKCGVRKNIKNELYSLNYGKLSAINIDPIEKKPLYKFMEGSQTLSIGSFGCNFACAFCQNYSISKEIPSTMKKSPEEIVKITLNHKIPSISYTYNEPTIFYEFMLDTAKIAKHRGLKNIVVTNGYIEKEPLEYLLQYVDGMNIDLKAYRDEAYRNVCDGSLEPVKKSIELANKFCHLEVTTLIVPGMNDDLEELTELFQWLASVDKTIPIHLSRYFPRYQWKEPATSPSLMMEAKKIAETYLTNVYLGNI